MFLMVLNLNLQLRLIQIFVFFLYHRLLEVSNHCGKLYFGCCRTKQMLISYIKHPGFFDSRFSSTSWASSYLNLFLHDQLQKFIFKSLYTRFSIFLNTVRITKRVSHIINIKSFCALVYRNLLYSLLGPIRFVIYVVFTPFSLLYLIFC